MFSKTYQRKITRVWLVVKHQMKTLLTIDKRIKNKNITKQAYNMSGPVAQNGLRHRPAEPKIVGSSPTGPASN